jgi:hypothetical protein
MPAWEAFFRCVNANKGRRSIPKAGLSEYEIYFNYVFGTCDQGHIRSLRWKNCKNMSHILMYKERGFDYVACHSYDREDYERPERSQTLDKI